MASRQRVGEEVGRRVSNTVVEHFRLAALGTATYLSYWTLFFSVCRACGDSTQRAPQTETVSRRLIAT